ncbi:MAG TPA: hypothetical protein VN612_09910 [Acidobacteriaceae bacterium]|nr:hypothetical protein [Acidobacteriaceae bacterium]
MRFKHLLLPALLAAFLAAVPATHAAQVSFGVQIGSAPVCPYGYYDYAPYNCAPYGYYGPEWFSNGVFIGAGPWFHGPHNFYGHVDRHFDPHYGYHGGYPPHNEHFDNHRNFHDFHGNYMSDGHGHERASGRSNHDRH